MKILIRGAGFTNKGAEAMLRVVQRELGRRLSNAVFFVTVPESDSNSAYKSGFLPVSISRNRRKKLLMSIPFSSKIPEFLLSTESLISATNPEFAAAVKLSTKAAYDIDAVGEVDAVIDISGFAYGDAWPSTAKIKEAIAWVEFCQRKEKPFIFLPQAWGSFENNEIAIWARKICQSKSVIFSRDDESSLHLARLQGISFDKIRTFPDIVFNFKGSSYLVGHAILRNLGLEAVDRPKIALVPNMRVYERTDGIGAENHYVKFLTSISNYCIDSLGASLLLLPNEILPPGIGRPDDRFLCGIIASQISNNEHCLVIDDNCPSETIKSILGQADLLIASRFHSLVFALAQGIPSVALGWSHKYRELLKHFGMENCVIDHDKLQIDEVLSLVTQVWENKAQNKQRILAVVPQLQRQVEEMFDEVASIIAMSS